jgi:hypothetical protein
MGSDATIGGIFIFFTVAALVDFPKVELTGGILLFTVFTYLRVQRSRLMLRAKRVREAERKYVITESEGDLT